MKFKTSKHGFTLIELLVVIAIIAFLTVAAMVTFNIVRMNGRDAKRVAEISTITRALAMYLNDSTIGYPTSTNGECLSQTSIIGAKLVAANVLAKVPTDPLWPTAAPSTLDTITGAAASPSSNFCYFYVAKTNTEYYISYYLESNSKAGSAGIHVSTASN